MKYESITDIYSANQLFHEEFTKTLAVISETEASALPDGEKWSIKQIVEHVSMVNFGVSRICAKLLESAKADAISSDGSFSLSANFGERAAEIVGLKVEAPERVVPTGNVSIGKSLANISQTIQAFASLKAGLESLDFSAHKFPHPFFSDLDAGQWLVMSGWHQQRHTRQIESVLRKVRDSVAEPS